MLHPVPKGTKAHVFGYQRAQAKGRRRARRGDGNANGYLYRRARKRV